MIVFLACDILSPGFSLFSDFVCFVGWKPFRSMRTTAGLWDLCRIKEVTLVLGEMDVARGNPYRSDQGTSSALGLVDPTVSGGHPIPGGGRDTISASYPVDDVHQGRIT